MTRNRPLGFWFLGSALLLMAIVVTTIAYAGAIPEIRGDVARRALEDGNSTVFVREVNVPAGWGSNVPGYIVSGFWVWDDVAVDFYVVSQGGADDLQAGRTPVHIYLHYANVSQTYYGTNPVVWPESGETRIEYVWFASGSQATPAVRTAFRNAAPAEARHQELGDTGNPIYLVDPDAAPLLPVFLGVGSAALVATVVCAALWFRRAKVVPADPQADGTEALLYLVRRGEQFLRQVRTLLRLVAALLLFVLPALAFVVAQAVWSLSTGINWEPFMPLPLILVVGGSIAAYTSAWLVWLRHYLNVRRELKRWTTHASPPAILD